MLSIHLEVRMTITYVVCVRRKCNNTFEWLTKQRNGRSPKGIDCLVFVCAFFKFKVEK